MKLSQYARKSFSEYLLNNPMLSIKGFEWKMLRENEALTNVRVMH